MTTTYYAAIDATDPVTGTVYGIGQTETGAARDALRGEPSGNYRVVPCTAAAYARIDAHGGAPSPELTVGARGVCLRSEEKAADRSSGPVHLSADDRATWQADVDDCAACQALDGEEVCSDHDLDDETVALRYSGSGE